VLSDSGLSDAAQTVSGCVKDKEIPRNKMQIPNIADLKLHTILGSNILQKKGSGFRWQVSADKILEL
jgi:hypothetical protein